MKDDFAVSLSEHVSFQIEACKREAGEKYAKLEVMRSITPRKSTQNLLLEDIIIDLNLYYSNDANTYLIRLHIYSTKTGG